MLLPNFNTNRLPLSTHSADTFDPGEWISQAEASRIRGVSRQAIAKLVANGRLRCLEIGGLAVGVTVHVAF
jgi:hypothetical protein